jgi:hypothetical protein
MKIRHLAVCAALTLGAMAGTAQAQYYYYPTQTYPVYAQPAPVYSAPVYYSQPVYTQPVYAQPVYAAPVYAQPVYAEPVYSGYYSPLSIGLNFGFGGRRWH